MNRCKHFLKPFFGVFSGSKKPTEEQIRKHKLYQCSKCYKWFSWLGEVEEDDN